MDKGEFISLIKEGALEGYNKYKILPSLIIAQAILESAWGSSELSKRGNNLFGIKAALDWKGKRITMDTVEWYGDKKEIIKADFRAYDNFSASIEDHNNLILCSRYTKVRECTDYKAACQKIYESGYATDPEYPRKLIRIIEENNLYEFDVQSEGNIINKVRKFQKLCNDINVRDSEGKPLIEDNILGWRTKSCIEALPVLKLGTKGQAVEFVQQLVKATPVDGEFGAVTKKCVMDYQRDNNLMADGIVGLETWTSLITK